MLLYGRRLKYVVKLKKKIVTNWKKKIIERLVDKEKLICCSPNTNQLLSMTLYYWMTFW